MNDTTITIRPAQLSDFEELYAFGTSTPELRVSAAHAFMDADEFRSAIVDKKSVLLVAQHDSGVLGFVYANTDDIDKPIAKKWGCLVYLAVAPAWRRKGIASNLYDACITRLREIGITHLYAWAALSGDGGIAEFLNRKGFAAGHTYQWMDKEI